MLISRWEIPPGYLRTTESSISASASTRMRARVCVRACTLSVKSPHTSARPRLCVHLSTFVSIACEKRRVERSDRSLQRVVQILSDRSRRIRRTALLPFPWAKRFILRRDCWSIAATCCDFIKSHLRREMAWHRGKIPLALSSSGILNISQKRDPKTLMQFSKDCYSDHASHIWAKIKRDNCWSIFTIIWTH